MERYLIILFFLVSICLKSVAAYYTNSLPTYNTNYSTDSFYGKFKTKLLKLDKFSPGTNSYNTFVVSQNRGPFNPKVLRDINGDGKIDFLSQAGTVIKIALGANSVTTDSTNITTTSFATTNLIVPLPSEGFKLVATGDIDGDEDIDLILQKGNQVTAYLANGGFYQQSQLHFANSLVPGSKVIGISNQDAQFVEVNTLDQAMFTGGGGFNIQSILNTVAIVSNLPSLIVKVGRDLFQYTNSNGTFFPSELPFYSLQPKEKVVGVFDIGLNPRVTAVSTKTTLIIEPVPPGEAPRNLTVLYSNTIANPSVVLQKGRSVFALSKPNPSSTPILIVSNRAGVKIIGPK